MRNYAICGFLILNAAAPASASSPSEAAKAWQEGRLEDAVAIWKILGAKDDRDALYNLGQSARTGRGMLKDSSLAISFYRKALKLGHPKAGEVLGLMLFAVPATKNEGLALLQDAAKTGSPRANFAIAATNLPLAKDTKDIVVLRDQMKIALAGGIDAAKVPLESLEQRLASVEVKVAAPIVQKPTMQQPIKIASVETNAIPIPGGKSWRVSLGQYESNNVAIVKWMRISARQRLKAFPVFIEPISQNYQLSFGNFAHEADALKLCQRLDADKTKCSIFKVS
jgi:SPOR domain